MKRIALTIKKKHFFLILFFLSSNSFSILTAPLVNSFINVNEELGCVGTIPEPQCLASCGDMDVRASEAKVGEILKWFQKNYSKSPLDGRPIDIKIDINDMNAIGFSSPSPIPSPAHFVFAGGGYIRNNVLADNYGNIGAGACYTKTKYLTDDAIVAVVCHELGHIMGGIPKLRINIEGKDLIDADKLEFMNKYRNSGVPVENFRNADFLDNLRKSTRETYAFNRSEGFADYYAAQNCMKRYFTEHLKSEPARILRIEHECKKSSSPQLCISILNAAYDFNHFLIEINDHVDDLSQKSDTVATKTISGFAYPSNACRFDIAIAAVLCENNSEYPCGFNKNGKYIKKTENEPPACFFKR